jgi:hypothetical protein
VLLPKDEGIKPFPTHVEIGVQAYKLFEELQGEKVKLSKAIARLNTVQRKGKADIHILELPGLSLAHHHANLQRDDWRPRALLGGTADSAVAPETQSNRT